MVPPCSICPLIQDKEIPSLHITGFRWPANAALAVQISCGSFLPSCVSFASPLNDANGGNKSYDLEVESSIQVETVDLNRSVTTTNVTRRFFLQFPSKLSYPNFGMRVLSTDDMLVHSGTRKNSISLSTNTRQEHSASSSYRLESLSDPTFASSSLSGESMLLTITPKADAVVTSKHALTQPLIPSDIVAGDPAFANPTYNGPNTIGNYHAFDQSTLEGNPVTIGGYTLTPNNEGAFVIGSETLVAGGPAVKVSRTLITLDRSSGLHIGNNLYTLPTHPSNSIDESPVDPILTGGVLLTSSSTRFAVDGHVIISAGQQIVTDETTLPIDPPISVDTSTVTPITIGGDILTPNPTGFIVGSHVITSNGERIVTGDTTILPGGASVTIASTAIALDKSGHLTIGSRVISLLPPTIDPRPTADPPIPVRIGTQTVLADATGFVVDGTPVRPGGPAITDAGTRISLGADGLLQIGNKVMTLPESGVSNGQMNSTWNGTAYARPTGGLGVTPFTGLATMAARVRISALGKMVWALIWTWMFCS